MLARRPPARGAMLASSGVPVASAGPGAVHLARSAKSPAAYAPHRPEETVLHGLVRENLESFLAHARETYERPLPRYVEQALRGYLRCGVFAHGFLRFHCDECGQDLLIAFSCKGRGLCPSCGAPLSPRRLTGYRTTSSRTVLLHRDTAFRQNGSRQRPVPGA